MSCEKQRGHRNNLPHNMMENLTLPLFKFLLSHITNDHTSHTKNYMYIHMVPDAHATLGAIECLGAIEHLLKNSLAYTLFFDQYLPENNKSHKGVKRIGVWSMTGVFRTASCKAKLVMASIASRPFLISAASINLQLYTV